MKKSLLFFFLVLCCSVVQTYAQSKTITGKVTSAEDGYPLPGVTVKIKGTGTGTQTDATGTYKINASSGTVLVYSFLGMETVERTVGTASAINVDLKTDATALKEVTVTTGFGVKQSQRDLTSAVQVIKGSDIQSTQRENFLNSLNGRVAGATVTSTSGNPGASSAIVLRGINSIGGSNSPLFVIDGVRVNNDPVDQANFVSNGANRSADFTNRIADLNPDDIENVTILKGADASAVYGSSASGGAIVITTRKGRSGAGMVSYDDAFSFSTAYRFPQVQTTYGIGSNGVPSGTDRRAFGPLIPSGVTTYQNLQNIVQTGTTQMHNISAEGGNENSTYRVSGSYRHATGVLPVAYNDKLSLRLSGSTKVSPKFTASGTFNYFNIDNRKNNKGATGTYLNALAWPTIDDARNYENADGTRRLILPASTGNVTAEGSVDFDNPLWDMNHNFSRDKTNRMVSTTDLSYDPFKWLNIRGLMGVDFSATNGNNMISQFSSSYQNSPLNGFAGTSGISSGGIIDNYTDVSTQLNGSLFATVKKTFGDFRTTLAIGVENVSNVDDSNGFYGEKFIQPDFNSINNTLPTTQRTNDFLKRVRYLSSIARANVVYKEMITLNATARREGSSNLYGTLNDNYVYFYPSVGAGFIFTELPALKDNKVLTYGKLRASYAEVGKDLKYPYKIFSTLLQQTTTGGGFAYDVTGNNPLLKPERDRQFDVGAEFQFFNGRLGADISYYQTIATNQIFAPRTSYATGYILAYVNGGEVRNHGVEITLTGAPVKTKDFSWDMTMNFTAAHGTVSNLGGLPEYYNSDTWLYLNVRSSVFPGSSTSNIASYSYARNNAGQILIDPTSGLPISNATFVVSGDRQPKFTIGLGNHFNYKGLDLAFLLDFRNGGDIFNGNELFLTRYGLSTRTLNRNVPVVVPGVLKDGNENSANPTSNTIQVTPYNQNGYYTGAIESDFIEHNIRWLRMRDVTLSYKLPASVMGHQKVLKSASVFATGTDLFLITNYSGADPEVNGTNSSTAGVGAAGFDYGTLPTPRTISFGVKVTL